LAFATWNDGAGSDVGLLSRVSDRMTGFPLSSISQES
jgi:hypothetical protein